MYIYVYIFIYTYIYIYKYACTYQISGIVVNNITVADVLLYMCINMGTRVQIRVYMYVCTY